MKKSLGLLFAIVFGILLPSFGAYSFLVQWLLMAMLFLSFLQMDAPEKMFREKRVFFVLLANIAIGVLAYAVFSFSGRDLAIIAFLLGAMPTATAAPAVISFLKGNIDFSIASVLLTNLFMALFWPIFLWGILSVQVPASHLFFSILSVVFFPLLIAKFFKILLPDLTRKVSKNGMMVSFSLWLIIVFLAVANASSFFFSGQSISPLLLFSIITLAAALCWLNFWTGKRLGGNRFGMEASQSLGQKNTMFSLWVALQFFSPIVALGPIFYLVFHNLYNSYLLAVHHYKNRL